MDLRKTESVLMIFYKEGNCMKFFSDFERKYQKYAIRNLMYYITILYAVGLIVWMLVPMLMSVFAYTTAQSARGAMVIKVLRPFRT